MNDFEIVFAEIVCAVLIMLGDARVMPLFFAYCSFMLFPADFARAVGLANVDGFFRACASVFVYSFLFFFRCMCFIFAT